jgi:eukaryotic-like serine/threonine-protein kinase
VEESLEIRRKMPGEDSPQYAGTLTVEANLLLAQRRYAEARKVAAQARSILAATLPADHWQLAMAMNAEGAALLGLGNYDKAESLLLESLPRLEGSPLPGLANTGRARLARLYTEWGKPEKAGQYQAAN